ncbi:MAG TPA: VOC family protein [Solirubrobacteraceae bacterium]|jgi:catechol 2,3-dioxygenase-like lactoylglutathione lyase family enzyme|nr:VOC family protein [Solirubrobacteraceae bacterium]
MPSRRIVIDHVSIGVSDLAGSAEFYRRALKPLGFEQAGPWREGVREVSFGIPQAHDFAISLEYPVTPSVHVAFAADDRDQVDAFHAAALAAGGRDNGAPGLRPEYSAGYYGAFVLDLDGYNVEAVHLGPD